jgi:hypothetical protein
MIGTRRPHEVPRLPEEAGKGEERMTVQRLRELLKSFQDNTQIVVLVSEENPVRYVDEARWVEVVRLRSPDGLLTKVRIKDPNEPPGDEVETHAALALTVYP